MKQTFIDGLAGLADDYDVFVLDLWGVVHNGREIYPNAAECMAQLRAAGKTVILMSNAPRPGRFVRKEIGKYQVREDLFDDIITSGDMTVAALERRRDPWHAALGRKFYHLGPDRSSSLIGEINDEAVSLAEADYILTTGVVDDETEQAEDYREMLSAAIARGQKLICANPDKVVVRGTQIIPCAGAVAELFIQLGGDARLHGKPYSQAYDMLFERLGEVARERCIMVGDTFATDIAGGRAAGLDTLWIAQGIFAHEVSYDENGELEEVATQTLIARHGETPTYVAKNLAW